MLVTATDQWGVSTKQSASNKKIVIKVRVVEDMCRDDKFLLHMHECIGASVIHPDICVATLTHGLKSFDTWTGCFYLHAIWYRLQLVHIFSIPCLKPKKGTN